MVGLVETMVTADSLQLTAHGLRIRSTQQAIPNARADHLTSSPASPGIQPIRDGEGHFPYF